MGPAETASPGVVPGPDVKSYHCVPCLGQVCSMPAPPTCTGEGQGRVTPAGRGVLRGCGLPSSPQSSSSSLPHPCLESRNPSRQVHLSVPNKSPLIRRLPLNGSPPLLCDQISRREERENPRLPLLGCSARGRPGACSPLPAAPPLNHARITGTLTGRSSGLGFNLGSCSPGQSGPGPYTWVCWGAGSLLWAACLKRLAMVPWLEVWGFTFLNGPVCRSPIPTRLWGPSPKPWLVGPYLGSGTLLVGRML